MSTPTPTPHETTRLRAEDMPDPDNLHIDRFALPIAPQRLRPAPAIGERLGPARHRAEYTRTA